MSHIPLFGLVDTVSVVRQKDVDDGAGGVTPGAMTTIYSSIACRITTMSDDDEQQGYGNLTGHRWKVVFPYSPNILRSDLITVPWGTFPNVAGPSGLPDGFHPTLVISTPAGSKTLTWTVNATTPSSSKYQDTTGNYTLQWTGSVWRFINTVASLTYNFTGYEQHHNITNLDWSTLVGASYAVTSRTGPTAYYRVTLVKHQRDDAGVNHHTSVHMELEDADVLP